MSTFFGQAPTTQMLLPSVDTSAMRREIRELDAAIEDWKRRNPPPSIGSDQYSTWSARFDRQMGDKVARARFLRLSARSQPLVQTASELNPGTDRTARGLFIKAKAAYDRGDGEGPLEDMLIRQYNAAYYKYLYAGDRDFDDEDEFTAAIAKDKYAYATTLLNVKPDPMGRFLLCDLRTTDTVERTILCLAGEAKGLPLGETHPDPSEGCYEGYLRMHSGRPGGVRAQMMGLGSTLYLGTTLAASMFGGFKGIFSMDGGCGSIRTDDADKLWKNLVDYGLAQEDEAEDPYGGGSESDEESDEDYTSYSDDYPSGGGGEPVQYMDTRRLMKHPAVAFTCSGNSGLLPPHHKSAWMEQAKGDRPAGTPRYGGAATRRRSMQLSDDILAAHWKDANTPKLADRRTVEMLAASMHGTSPMLVVFIAEAIQNSGHPKAEDLTVAYLTRPDIASMVKGNQRVMELLGQQRLPGLGGLSRAALRDVMGAVRVGRGLGAGDNPLHLPKQSAELKRLIQQYPEF